MMGGKKGFISSVIVALVGYAAFRYVDKADTPIVKTSLGDVVGFVSRSREGTEFFQFLGIPYGKPPVGERRFEPPQPAEKWEGVRKGKKYASMCTHVNTISKSIDGSEDCLYLNVFTPKFTENARPTGNALLPVFVYIHGGYFMAGGSNYMGPYYLMEEQVIVVTVNYRLASLGFLNTGDGTINGNMGLKDQSLALQFVQREIENFGGDPNNVILWGESAGAAAVHFHLLSPMSKGLFRKAIMASGTAIKPWSLVLDPKKQAILLAETLNCPTNDTQTMVKCLKSVSSHSIMETHSDALDSPIMDPLKIFAPSIETENPSNAFLAKHPYDVLKDGEAHRVPLLTGVNSHEGLLATGRIYYRPGAIEEVENNWNRLSPKFLYYTQSLTNVTTKIRQFYMGDSHGKVKFHQRFTNLTNIFSDRWYIHSMKETVRIQAEYSPVYLYYFNYPLQRGLTFFYDITPTIPIYIQIAFKVVLEWINKYIFERYPEHLGTCHGDELVLLFNFPMVYVDVGHEDYELSRQMVKAFVQFAYDDSLLTVGDTVWTPVNVTTGLKYMYFGNDTATHATLIDEPFIERMEFWDSLNLPWKMSL